MQNIKFIGREEDLQNVDKLKGKNFFLVVKGRRRIGKTTFLKKCFPDATYIFVWPNKSIGWITQEICTENSLPQFRNFKDVIQHLIGINKTIVIDEFQNLYHVDKSVYGEIQKIVDENKDKFMRIAVAGSSYSLINKVFGDSASPLYGRRTAEINLSHLSIQSLYSSLGLSLEEFIKIWSVFQGVPYYYELVKFENAEKDILDLFFSKNALLMEEGKAILSIEFGSNSKTYSTVLSAIAEGKTKLNEIASLFGDRKSEAIKYIDLLRKEFNLVTRVTPILSDPRKSKSGVYQLNDNLFKFWFLFVDKQRIYIEQGRLDELESYFSENFNSFVGRAFENFITELIKNKAIFSDLRFEKIGRQWGNDYEIDILCLGADEIYLCECKWKEKVTPENVARDLIVKSKYLNLNKKEVFVIFAKSFTKKIDECEGRKVICIDLKELEKNLKVSKRRDN